MKDYFKKRSLNKFQVSRIIEIKQLRIIFQDSHIGKAIILILILLSTFSSCKKLIEVDAPNTNINAANIYEKDATAIAVLSGIYTNLSQSGIQSGGLTSISSFAGLSSDELMIYRNSTNQQLNAFYSNSLNNNVTGFEFWNSIFPIVYSINASLEGISNSTKLTPAVKTQLLGEAKFMRAFCYFYLVNLYGDVPLVLTTDYKINSTLSRTPSGLIWKQILEDLKDAIVMLNDKYVDGSILKVTNEKVRPTKWAAMALLSRTYLYTKDWVDAENQASVILENSQFKLVALDQVFNRNNDEAILQFQPVLKGFNSQEANTFILSYDFDLGEKPSLSENLLNDFELGDQRKINWINNAVFNGETFYYCYKYKILPSYNLNIEAKEYSTIIRLAEQYLIRAEARIQLGKISDGIADLNIIRDRATNKTIGAVKLPQLPLDLSQQDALDALMHERRIELFAEWGHRWLDIKRTGLVDQIMKTVLPHKLPGGSWKSFQQLYPLPIYDLQKNPNLIQNKGY